MKLLDAFAQWFPKQGAAKQAESWLVCCFNRGREEDDEDQQESLLRRPVRKYSQVNRAGMFLANGTAEQLRDTYVIRSKVLGKGGFGTVRLAHLKGSPHTVRAVKDVRKKTERLERTVHREIGVLRLLDHPNICRLFEVFEDQQRIYLVLEYIDGRELFDEIQEEMVQERRFDERRAACIMHQVFCALHYCHDHGIIHRDLKPENIMVCRQQEGADTTTPVIKIVDFGLAVINVNAGYSARQLEGTEAYLAPESKRGVFVPVSDVWSAGVILHIILLGSFPDPLGISAVDPEALSPTARQLLEGLLEEAAERRLTAAAAAQHPWTTGNYERSPGHEEQITETMGCFVNFCKGQKVRKAALTAMATQMPSQSAERLREQFQQIDTDGNGTISKEELLAAVRRAPPDGVTDVEAWVQATFDELDTDASGEIEFTEWYAAALGGAADFSEDSIRDAFRVLDADGSGSISAQELMRVIGQTPDEIKDGLSEFDLNGDGLIDFEEFHAMFQALPKKCLTASLGG